MPKPITRAYSRYTRDACTLMGGLIRTARIERKLTVQELAERAGISRGLLQRIEKGDLKCEVGAVFEAATIVGIQLFDSDQATLSRHLQNAKGTLALLPKSIHKPSKKAVHDDF